GVLTLGLSAPSSPGPWCDMENRRRIGPGGPPMPTAFDKLLPVLELPGSDSRAAGQSSRLDSLESNAAVSGGRHSMRSLTRAFSRQMSAQGWQRDAEWRGNLGAGSTWTHPAEDGRLGLAAVEVREGTEDEFLVTFRMRMVCGVGEVAEGVCREGGVDG